MISAAPGSFWSRFRPRGRQWLGRLMLLVFIGAGGWLWKGSWFPQQRHLVFLLDDDHLSIREMEIQVWDRHSQLLKREEFYFQQPPGPEISTPVSLKAGDYLVRVFVRRIGRSDPGWYEQGVHVEGEDEVAVSLARSRL